MKKLIDFEILKANCGHKTALGVCNKDTCPIWNRLPDLERVRRVEEWCSSTTIQRPNRRGAND